MSGQPDRPARHLLRYARYARWRLLAGVLLGPLSTAGMLAQPLAAKALVDDLGADRPLGRAIAVLTALVVTSAALRGVTLWMLERAGEKIVLTVRRRLIGRLLRLTVDATDWHAPGDLTSRITADTGLLRAGSSRGIADVITGSLGLAGAVVLMATIDLRLLAAALGVVGCLLGASFAVLARSRFATERAQHALGAVSAALEPALTAARVVKANQSEQREFGRIAAEADRAYAAGLQVARRRALTGLFAGLAVHVAFLVVLAWGGALAAAGSLELSGLIAFLLYLFYLTSPVGALTNGAGQIIQALGACTRLTAIERMPVEQDEAPADAATGVPGTPAVAFADVTFRYRDDRPYALKGLSFVVPTGGLTAIVGPSGAGKSTVFELLLRFRDPSAGCIRLGGVDVRDVPRSLVRRRLAYVPQDVPILGGTVAECLRYGAPETTDAELTATLRVTRLDEVVRRLPAGLDTDIGPRGHALSGGERQRLAIAQALLRRSDVLLLDEVTSQLDALNEQAMRDTIAGVARTRTVLVIAHRMSTVRDADRIVVLDGGRVRAVGRHRDVLAADALYRRLAAAQLVEEVTR